MEHDPLWIFRCISFAGLILTVTLAFVILKKADALFGPDPHVLSENASSRSYSRILVFAILAHLLIFFSAGILFL